VRRGVSTLFEFCPIGVYRSLPAGTLLRVNPALAQLNGYASEDEMLAQVKDIATGWYVEPGQHAQFMALLQRDGVVRDFVSEVRRHGTGERIWVREHAHMARDERDAVDVCEATVEEITHGVEARAALRRSEEQLRTITAQIPGLVYRLHVSPEGRRRFDFVSSGVRDIFGIEPAAVLADGDLLRSYTHPDDLPLLSSVTSVARQSGAPVVLELRTLPPDGGIRWVQLTSAAVSSDEPGVTRIGVIVDITERKLAQTLRMERDQAAAAQRATTQLLSRMSHELRTPLNAILGFAQLLELGHPTEAQQARCVREILASGRHLLALVDDVLDLSSTQSGQQPPHLESIDLGKAVAQACTMLAGEAETAGIRMELPALQGGPTRVSSDTRRLRQVLGHLLSNAIKYNRPGGRVAVTIARQGERVDLTVADNGIGMTRAQLARLFTPFDRLGVEHSGIAGTGLGLTLSKQLVESMAGTIAVHSVAGEGSAFTVGLPAAT